MGPGRKRRGIYGPDRQKNKVDEQFKTALLIRPSQDLHGLHSSRNKDLGRC